MEGKINLLVTMIMLFIFSSCGGQVINNKSNENEIEKVKKFALCNCLYETIPEGDKVKKKEGSSSHYLQSSELPIEVYTKSLTFIKEYLLRTEKDYVNYYEKSNVGIVRCLDLYESEELDSLIKKLISEN